MFKKTRWCCFIKELFSRGTLPQQQQLKGRLKPGPKGLSSPKRKLSDSEVPESITICGSEAPRCTNVATDEANMFTLNPQLKSHAQHQAATKIQTSYRGHLARKALRALKGLVTLQAIIRGRVVRRQAADMLKCLQSIVNIQSDICARRRLMTQGTTSMCRSNLCRSNFLSQDVTTQKSMVEKSSEPPTKKLEIDVDTILRKKEDIVRQEGVNTNIFNRRNSVYLEENSDPHERVKYIMKQYLDKNSRRSFQNKRCNNEHLPSYMAATKSTRAKATSLTSPRYLAMQFDAYSDGDSPYKIKFSPMSSVNSETIRNNHTVNHTKKILI